MLSWHDQIDRKLTQLEIVRKRQARVASTANQIETSAGSFLNLVSNNYLGVHNHSSLIRAFTEAANLYGIGSTSAATLGGYTIEHELLEAELAQWLGYQRALLFNSGYQLNVGIFSQLCSKDSVIWLDKNCHASHIDGVLLAKAHFKTFHAIEIQEVCTKIRQQNDKLHIILTEGTFSMDGSSTYLNELVNLKKDGLANLLLIIDDAHGVGALGKNGYGSLEQLNLPIHYIDLFIATFGKAFASHGGFIAGNNLFIEYLQQTTRSQIFTTCLPPAIVAATRASLQLIRSPDGDLLRIKLAQNIQYFRKLAASAKISLFNASQNQSPIQLVVFNSIEGLLSAWHKMYDAKILLGKIAYPTVPKETPRLRISLNASLSFADIERLITKLASC